MPPSPAMRFSPGREQRGAESHKRGRSLEGAFMLKEKEDDLALFSEMQSREREDFLMQSSDDFEDTFSSKLKHFSDVKLGISISARGESSELLNVEGDKNDYDWLLTPPETPLFPSLDDEPLAAGVATRGRPRSQPISISRSSTMDKSHRSSRGSASPNRLSPSPRSGTSSTSQSRGRTSSSPTSVQRPASPSRKPSPPPSKVSTSAPRSSTPTSRRTSTGSSIRGTSPVRTNRGSSASPKIGAWQSNIPGFSSEAPPNLRTSLADRPASYVRGSSPASRNSRDSASQFGRKSMSPSPSRSGSSHSQDRDRISSHSRGSVDSGGDDDLDSMQSYHVGSLDRLASKRVGALQANRSPAFPKKSTKVFSPSSAPKRSFDSVLRQMDHRKSPPNMFRPLLSSVSSSTFYVGKASSAQRSLISRNSSVTTSSNASSDQGTTAALDSEGSAHQPEDVPTESEKGHYADVHEEVFAFETIDAPYKLIECDGDDNTVHQLRLGNFDGETAVNDEPSISEELIHHDIDGEFSSTSEHMGNRADFSEVDSLASANLCFRCGCKYNIETVETDVNLCPGCIRQENLTAAVLTQPVEIVAAKDSMVQTTEISTRYEAFDEPELTVVMPELQVSVTVGRISSHKESMRQDQNSYDERGSIYSHESSAADSMVDGLQDRIQLSVGHNFPSSGSDTQQLSQSNESLILKTDSSEGAGISVLLKRSTSGKGHVVEGRPFIASPITYDDLLYARDSVRSLRSSLGHGSTSASSSVDFSSVRSGDTRVQRQLSVKKGDIEVSREEFQTRPQSASSCLSNYKYQAGDKPEDANDLSSVDTKYDGAMEERLASHVRILASEDKDMDLCSTSVVDQIVPELRSIEGSKSNDVDLDASSCLVVKLQAEDKTTPSLPDQEQTYLSDNEKDLLENGTCLIDQDASTMDNGSFVEAHHCLDAVEAPTHRSLVSISEIQLDNCSQSYLDSDNDVNSGSSKSIMNEIQDLSRLQPEDKNESASVLEEKSSDGKHGLPEESMVILHSRGESNPRSLTLEEATDTILFCSSIVNDLAYHAASIAVEKESSVLLEGSKPTVTILGKSNASRKDPHGRTAGKRPSKSLKVRQKRQTSIEQKSPSYNSDENDENANEGMVRNVGLPSKMDGMKPPKLESKCNCTIM